MFEDSFRGFIDERLEHCVGMLRKDHEEYLRWDRRHAELRQKLDTISISEGDMELLQEYFQLEFDLAAANQPAIYRAGFAEGIRLLLLLDVL